MSWQTKTLGELCTIELGATPARRNPNFYDEKKETSNVWLSIRDMPKTIGEVLFDSKEYLSDEGAEKVKLVKKGTLLFSFKLTIGRICFAGRDLRTNEAIAALSEKNDQELNKEYLAWFLASQNWDEITAKDEKLLGKTLNKSKLKVLSISYPRLEEQKRIVAILDEAFAGIDQAIANTEKNLAAARELFESYLNSIFLQKGQDWPRYQLDELTEDDTKITYGVVKPGPEGDVPFVRGGDIANGQIKIDKLRTITKEISEQYKRTLLRGGEILICLVGVPGQTAVASEGLKGANIARQVGLIRLKNEINPHFISLFLRSRVGLEGIGAYTGGSVQQVINLRDLKLVSVPLPDRAIQDEVVSNLEVSYDLSSTLEQGYQHKLTALNELKQSLLQKAFSGELTADMADEAQAEAAA